MKPGAMGLLDHLEELRWTLLKMLLLLAAGAVAGWFVYDPAFHLLMRPIQSLRPAPKLVTVAPADAFNVKLTLSVLLGLCLTLPGHLCLAWRFVSPGLKDAEKRAFLWAATAGTVFFCGGMAFGYSLLGFIINVLISFTPETVQPLWRFDACISFTFRLLLAFGLLFELPVIVVTLTGLGLVRASTLARIRPHMILAIFILAAILTPPDVLSQVFLAVPLVLLYELSLLACRFVERRLGY
ncbi:MAG TPA: twin-arginine translocase subunit TatC [Candidatus Brocadiia bacterium]|nr:twin-arginine translocase subunit TatC [Candidatus Brocadiia bacterium]